MAVMFYEIAEKIDKLKEIPSPSANEVEKLMELLIADEYTQYFFQGLNNPGWAKPLHDIGNFYQVPDPLEDKNQPGYFSMPAWHAGEYLKRMVPQATEIAEIVKEVALNLNTENSRAIRTMLEAIIEIPPTLAAETVEAYKKWAETPFASFMMVSREMGIIMEKLARDNQSRASLKVLEVLADPFGPKVTSDEEIIVAGTRFDYYWLEKTFQENLPILIASSPFEVLNVLENKLIKAIDLERNPKIDAIDNPLNSFWRLDISPDTDSYSRSDIKNFLVDYIILALEKAFEQKQDEINERILGYFDNDYSILRRIANFMLRSKGAQYLDLLEKAYLCYIVNPMIAGESEFNKLIQIQFGNLPPYIQYMERSEAFILQKKDIKRMEEIIEERPDQLGGNTKEKKRRTFIERRHLIGLNRFEHYLRGDDKKYYETLLNKYEKPQPRPEEGAVITSWEGPEAPKEWEELTKKTIKEVVQYLTEYIPPEDNFFGGPSREGLGRAFESDVQVRANEYAENASLFLREDLRFVFVYHYCTGLTNAWQNKKRFSISGVISLCIHVAEIQNDEFEKETYEPDLNEAKLAIARFIEKLLRLKEPSIDNKELDKIEKIVLSLLNQYDRFSDIGPEDEDIQEETRGFDPAMRSLNSVRGLSMHCLMLYGLYRERKRKAEEGKDTPPVLIQVIKESLEEKFDKGNDPSLAVHSVIGWYIPQLIYLDQVWVINNLGNIFPEDGNLKAYWRAAWDAYVRFSGVYQNVFPHLISQYKRALKELPASPEEQGVDRLDQKIGSHIMKAYISEMIEFDSDDGLMNLYLEQADDEMRSRGVFWLSNVLETDQPDANNKVWNKIWDLWQKRVEEVSKSDDRGNYAKEISSFSRLLKNVPLELKDMYGLLSNTLDLYEINFEMHSVIEFIGKESEKYPVLAVSLLHEIIISNRKFYMTTDTRDNVAKVFEVAKETNRKTKDKVIEIINIFGEQGDYEWRGLLDEFFE